MPQGAMVERATSGYVQQWATHPNYVGKRGFLCPECAWQLRIAWVPVQTPENAVVLGHIFHCGTCGRLLPIMYPGKVGRA
jgi:C4-type Zn-finger protein